MVYELIKKTFITDKEKLKKYKEKLIKNLDEDTKKMSLLNRKNNIIKR